MDISSNLIKELRSRTQAGFLECKKALAESHGDMEKAIEIIRKKGMASAVKRAGRSANEGKVVTLSVTLKDGQPCLVLFELNAETDFVAKNDLFISAAEAISKTLETFVKTGKHQTLTLQQVLELEVTSTSSRPEWVDKPIAEMVQMVSGTLGEKLELSRVVCLMGAKGDTLESYVHTGDKIAAAVWLKSKVGHPSVTQLAKDLAMQVAACSPLYMTPQHIPGAELEKEKSILLDSVIQSGKAKAIADKIVAGKLNAYYAQVCLMQQAFIKEPKKNVVEYTESVAKAVGFPIEVKQFVRIQVGESETKGSSAGSSEHQQRE
jgi:elongation factor Ts